MIWDNVLKYLELGIDWMETAVSQHIAKILGVHQNIQYWFTIFASIEVQDPLSTELTDRFFEIHMP